MAMSITHRGTGVALSLGASLTRPRHEGRSLWVSGSRAVGFSPSSPVPSLAPAAGFLPVYPCLDLLVLRCLQPRCSPVFKTPQSLRGAVTCVPPSPIFLPELPQAAKAAPDLLSSLQGHIQGHVWVLKPPSAMQGLGFCPWELGTCLAPWHKSLAAARAAAALSGAAQRGLLSAPAGVGSPRFPRRWSTEENGFLLRRGKLSAPLSRAVITGASAFLRREAAACLAPASAAISSY